MNLNMFLEIGDKKKLDWFYLSKNPNAIHLLGQNIDKINWRWLSENPNAISLLERNINKINWISHVVQSGDSLWKLAEKYGTEVTIILPLDFEGV